MTKKVQLNITVLPFICKPFFAISFLAQLKCQLKMILDIMLGGKQLKFENKPHKLFQLSETLMYTNEENTEKNV